MTDNNLHDTISVSSFSGKESELTRDEFVGQWIDHTREFLRLVNDTDRTSSKENYNLILSTATSMANEKFDHILNSK